jgi:hypothetical protein
MLLLYIFCLAIASIDSWGEAFIDDLTWQMIRITDDDEILNFVVVDTHTYWFVLWFYEITALNFFILSGLSFVHSMWSNISHSCGLGYMCKGFWITVLSWLVIYVFIRLLFIVTLSNHEEYNNNSYDSVAFFETLETAETTNILYFISLMILLFWVLIFSIITTFRFKRQWTFGLLCLTYIFFVLPDSGVGLILFLYLSIELLFFLQFLQLAYRSGSLLF